VQPWQVADQNRSVDFLSCILGDAEQRLAGCVDQRDLKRIGRGGEEMVHEGADFGRRLGQVGEIGFDAARVGEVGDDLTEYGQGGNAALKDRFDLPGSFTGLGELMLA
jgi:hypothetical protein